jgi:acyl-CoA thioesterase
MSSETEIEQLLSRLPQRSPIARDLGVELLEGRAGYARLALTVTDRMVNGAGNCHGGYIFMIGDMAGAYACLSRGQQCLTQMANITYVSPALKGDRLIAEGVEMARTRRSGTYDVRITADDGRLVALFRGLWRVMDQPIFPPSAS